MKSLLRASLIIFIMLLPSRVFAQDTPQAESPAATATELNIEDLRKRILKEAPEELMSYSLGDANVSLFITGTWYGELQANFGLYHSPIFGTGFVSPETPLLFKQEADLTMALWINERWFVEASFLDDSSQNTYRAGYQGLPGEFIQYAGVGNTGLDFPSFPYLDLGGDSPSSFGFYGRVGNDTINVHTLLRYDAASSEEKYFLGGRERTYSDLSPGNSLRGISFVLPDANIETDIVVYIEDEKGSIRDNEGRRWRFALLSEYSFSRTMGIVELSVTVSGMVAVSYGNNRPWLSSLGTYSGASGFLRDVQDWFDGINLSLYPQCGGGISAPGEVIIGGITALVVYEPGTFSPFEKRGLYNAPSSNTEKAALVSGSNGTEIGGYELINNENISTEDMPMFSDLGNPMFDASARKRSVFELVRSGSSDKRDPAGRWPLALEIPEIYLPGNKVYTGDISLRFTNYNSLSGYFIGTDVIPGSVQVWRSGIQDSNFTYNAASGEVIINGSIGSNEVIRVTYLKTNEAIQFGSIAAGVGAIYRNRANNFSAQAALGIRWNLSQDAFTEESQSSAGVVGISLKTAWDYDNLKAQVTGGFAFVQTDTTGLYRAAGMEGNELIISMPFDSSFISNQFNLQTDLFLYENKFLDVNKRAELVFRNYNDNNILGDNLMSIDWGAAVVSGVNKPYPVKDSNLGNTRVLVSEFTLDRDNNWTGFQIPLGANSEIISQASEIEIPFRFYNLKGDFNNFRLVIQIGSLSGMEFTFIENENLIWEKNLVPNELPADWVGDDYNARTVIAKFLINETDRLKLSDAKFLRLAAVYNGASEVSGRVLLAPPIVRGSAFRAIVKEGNKISGITDSVIVTETKEFGANTLESRYGNIVNKLHENNENQRVLKIEWDGSSPAGASVGADGRINRIPLENYRELSFFAKRQDTRDTEGNLRFVIAQGPDTISNAQLEAVIPLSALSAGQWKKITIRYNGPNKGIKIDGEGVETDTLKYNRLSSVMEENNTSYAAVLIEPVASLSGGVLYIDEIILEDPVMVYRMNAGTAVEYIKNGTLVSVAGFPVLENLAISTAVEAEGRAESETNDPNLKGSMVNRSGLAVSVLKTELSGNVSFTAAEETFLWDADHSIAKKIGAFYVKEAFYASPQSASAGHTVNMSFVSDFHAKFKADAQYDLSRLRQEWNLDTGYNPKNEYIPSLLLSAAAIWTKNDSIDEDENYGKLWLDSWHPLVPDTGEGALTRKTNTRIVLTQRTKPLGAVITLNGLTNYSDANTAIRSENSAFLDVPLVFDKLYFNFRAGKSYKRQRFYSSEDVVDDGGMFFKSAEEGLNFWQVFPFYSLFADELNSAMDKIEIDQYTAFNDHYSARVNLPNRYNLSSFFVPSRLSFRIERILEQKMDTRTDTLNLGGSIGFSSINMFGAAGYRPIFKFYQSDEFSHGIEASVIIPKDEEIKWGINSVINASFIGFSRGLLNYVNILTLRSDDYWTESLAVNWEIPTQKNILSVFYDWVLGSIERQKFIRSSSINSNYEQLRKVSLELVLDKSTDYLRWSVVAGHEEIVRIIGRMNFTTFIKLRFSEDLYTDIFMLDAMLGTTLRVSF